MTDATEPDLITLRQAIATRGWCSRRDARTLAAAHLKVDRSSLREAIEMPSYVAPTIYDMPPETRRRVSRAWAVYIRRVGWLGQGFVVAVDKTTGHVWYAGPDGGE